MIIFERFITTNDDDKIIDDYEANEANGWVV